MTLIHEGDGDLDKRGTLYILAIGVDQYPALGNTCGDERQRQLRSATTRAPTRAQWVGGGREAAGPGAHQGGQARAGQRRQRGPSCRPPATSSMPSTC